MGEGSDDAYSGSYCQGSVKYICNVELYSNVKAKLKLRVCSTSGEYYELLTSDSTDFSVLSWYTVSFTAVGDDLRCSLYGPDMEELLHSSYHADFVGKVS